MGHIDGGTLLGAQQKAILAELFENEWRPLCRFVRRLTNSAAEAEDIAAMVFEIAACRLRGGQDVTPQLLRTIARRRTIDSWRKAKTAADYAIKAQHEPVRQRNAIDTVDDRLSAFAELSRLSARDRRALVYRYVLDLPVKEVAILLDSTPKAAESLLVRARVRAMATSAA